MNFQIDSFSFQYFNAIAFLSDFFSSSSLGRIWFYARVDLKVLESCNKMKWPPWKQNGLNIWPRNSIGSSDKIHEIFGTCLMSAKNEKTLFFQCILTRDKLPFCIASQSLRSSEVSQTRNLKCKPRNSRHIMQIKIVFSLWSCLTWCLAEVVIKRHETFCRRQQENF